MKSSRRQPATVWKSKKCSTKVCWPTCLSMRMRLPPKQIMPFSRSVASRRIHAGGGRTAGRAGSAPQRHPAGSAERPPRRRRPRNLAKLPLEGAGQRLAENCQAGHQGPHSAGHERHEGRALAAHPRRHQDRRPGGSGIAQGQRRRSGEIRQPEKCAGSRASRHSDEAAVRQELRRSCATWCSTRARRWIFRSG